MGSLIHPRCAARSLRGRRERNEDAFCAKPDLGLFVVADGLGGHAGGDRASRIVVQSVARYFAELDDPGWDDPTFEAPASRLATSMRLANRQIAQKSVGELSEMGTTVAALLLGPGVAMVAHVGDSRVYRVRDGRAEQLTVDHSLVNEMEKASGVQLGWEVRNTIGHVVTRYLGAETDSRPDITLVAVREGDQFVLCTDGLSDVFQGDDIAAPLRPGSLTDSCDQLVREAYDRGSHDNITCVLVSV